MSTPEIQAAGEAETVRKEVRAALAEIGARLIPAGDLAPERLAARMDEAGYLTAVAGALLADPHGSTHACAACQRSDRPMRPISMHADPQKGLQWACRPCLVALMMAT